MESSSHLRADRWVAMVMLGLPWFGTQRVFAGEAAVATSFVLPQLPKLTLTLPAPRVRPVNVSVRVPVLSNLQLRFSVLQLLSSGTPTELSHSPMFNQAADDPTLPRATVIELFGAGPLQIYATQRPLTLSETCFNVVGFCDTNSGWIGSTEVRVDTGRVGPAKDTSVRAGWEIRSTSKGVRRGPFFRFGGQF